MSRMNLWIAIQKDFPITTTAKSWGKVPKKRDNKCKLFSKSSSMFNQHSSENQDSTFFSYISLNDWLQHQLPIHYNKLCITRPNQEDEILPPQLRILQENGEFCHTQRWVSNFDTDYRLGWCSHYRGQQEIYVAVGCIFERTPQERIMNPMFIALHSGNFHHRWRRSQVILELWSMQLKEWYVLCFVVRFFISSI